MVVFRPFADADYPALAELHDLVWGEPRSLAGLKAADADFPADALRVRLVAEQDGRPVLVGGYSETPWSVAPDKYFLSCLVHPAYQERGLGRAWYQHVAAELERRGARLLTATTRDDLPAAMRFLQRRGFRVTIREPESRLAVAAFDPAPFADHATIPGVSILRLPELQRCDGEWARRCWELEWLLWQDVPTSETFTREEFDEYLEQVTDPEFHPEGYFVAVDARNGQLVGTTHVLPRDGESDVWEFGLTGVVRSHRRRGIALALKLAAIRHAAEHGASTLVTDNEEGNPMYQLNLQLGFRFVCTWMGFERVAAETSADAPGKRER